MAKDEAVFYGGSTSEGPISYSGNSAPATPQRKSLVAKLAEVMAEVGWVKKTGRNERQGYDYPKDADLVNAVRGELAKRGIIVIPFTLEHRRTPVEVSADSGAKMTTGFLDDVMVEYTIFDSESGEIKVSRIPGTGWDKGDKGVYKALTGAMKYFLRDTFMIPTGDDPEGDTKTDEATGKQAQKEVAERKLQEIAQEEKIHQQERAFDSKEPAWKKNKISEAQGKRLWAIAHKVGWTKEEIEKLLIGRFKIASVSDIPRGKYEEIVAVIETPEPPAPPEGEYGEEPYGEEPF